MVGASEYLGTPLEAPLTGPRDGSAVRKAPETVHLH